MTTPMSGSAPEIRSDEVLRLAGPVRVLHGPAVGQLQPVLLADLAVTEGAGLPGPKADSLARLLGIATAEQPAIAAAETDAGQASSVANAVLHLTIALQQAAGQPVFGRGAMIASPGRDSVVTLVIPYADAAVARRALTWALRAVSELAGVTDPAPLVERMRAPAASLLAQLRKVAPRTKNGVNFLRAAHDLQVPWSRLTTDVYQVGQGSRARWLNSSINDRTSAIGVGLARDKAHSAAVLRRAGVPVPDLAVTSSIESAIAVAGRFGYPLVVKPIDRDGGVGVAAGLEDECALRRAYEATAKLGRRVLVEKHVEGRDFRLMVVGGEVRWVVERIPGGVSGDGLRPISELIAEVNADPRRGPESTHPLRTVDLDEEALELLGRQGLTVDSVPEAGHFVRLRRITNVARGGVPIVRGLDEVHPDNLRLAVRAAEALRLDVAGVDYITPDISRPWYETRSAVNEVNAQPSLGLLTAAHLFPEILRWLLGGTDGRIPTIAVVGDDVAASAAVASMIHRRLVESGACCGLATHEGAWVGSERVAWSDMSGIGGGHLLFGSPKCDSAVMAVAVKTLRTQGLAFDRCDVVVRLAPGRVTCPFEGGLLRGARHAVVLSADDSDVVASVRRAVKVPMILCGSASSPAVTAHVAKGGAAVYRDGDALVVRSNQPHVVLAVRGMPNSHHVYAQAALVALREPNLARS